MRISLSFDRLSFFCINTSLVFVHQVLLSLHVDGTQISQHCKLSFLDQLHRFVMSLTQSLHEVIVLQLNKRGIYIIRILCKEAMIFLGYLQGFCLITYLNWHILIVHFTVEHKQQAQTGINHPGLSITILVRVLESTLLVSIFDKEQEYPNINYSQNSAHIACLQM